MALEGRHRHKAGFEYYYYRKSFGRIAKFDTVIRPMKKRKTRFRMIIKWAKYRTSKIQYQGLRTITFREYYCTTSQHGLPYYF